MTDVLDPLRAADRIAGDYVRYLRSAFTPQDPALRADFDAQLADGRHLSRGPILQAVPPYATGASIRSLVDEGVLHPALTDLEATGFGVDRPLYWHQEQAVRRAQAGRNLIVATGTGSGKTESFLLPILDGLVREVEAGTAEQAGVRALLLYPMNALANDQLARLRDLLAPFPTLTFGRYVGDTEETRPKADAQYAMRFGGKPPANELVCRAEMKERPPHILITNFAMLEYLLLRPEEQRFFDGPTGEHWRHVVLDEIHVYDGAKGAEIGMLLRRVRERVRDGERGVLQCIGTSATLGRGAEDRPRLIDFAGQLFDEPFEWAAGDPDRQDIVEARRDELVQGAATWFCPEDRFIPLRDWFRAGADAADLAAVLGHADVPARLPDESTAQWLGRVLATETHVVALQHLLADGSVDIATAADQVMASRDAGPDLAALVDLCVGAELAGTARSLLPARWHFLLRALEGAYTCLSPDHPEDEPRVLLNRHQRCPGCAERRRESAMFEAAVCRRCGARYIVGEEELVDGQTVLRPPRAVAENPRTFLVADDALDADEDEDATATEESVDDRFDPAVVCVRCGAFGDKQVACGCGAPTASLRAVHPSTKGQPVRLCAACGGRTSRGSIVQRFLTGSDAPVAVVATSLYQELPPMGRVKGGVGDGRKLLSFADSRQDAAFFAPYLERTYNRAVQRRLLWEVMAELMEEGDEVLRIADLLAPLKNRAVRAGIVDEADEDAPPDRQARHWLYAEILSTDRQQNLEGVGLAEIAVPIPTGMEAPAPLLDLGLSRAEVFDLMRVLLDSVRRSRAVTIDSRVDLDDQIFEGRPNSGLRGDQSASGVISWNPSRGTNQRVKYLGKVLGRLGRDDIDPAELLRGIWDQWLADPHGEWGDVLVAEEAQYGKGVVRRLKASRLEFRPATREHRPLRCDTCRQIWWRSVRGACPGVNCPGTVEPVPGPVGRDHYRELYTTLSPIGLRVEEHTAQLSSNVAATRQQEFIDGRINALSCSTTFELGVDVGEIQAVLMRNVPPSAANYVQRAGRAGRRAGSPALVVTFAQRRSHDLHFFDHPHSMIDGQVAAPVVNVENPAIVRRHINAMGFAQFQRDEYERAGGEPDHRLNHYVDEFFLPRETSPADRMMGWLRTRPDGFGERVRRVVPPAVADRPDVGLDSWAWLDGLDGDPREEGRGRLTLAGRETRRELTDLDEQINQAYNDRNSKLANVLERVRKTVAHVRTLDRLARAGVLPKYGFPVDVVPLDLRGETAVELDRDLSIAIADFAPGNEIVADKRVWTSVGLKVEAGLTLLVHRWASCKNCHARWTWLEELDPPPCPSCGADPPEHGRRLIQPRFGFIGEDTGRRPGDNRPPKTAFTSSFFDDFAEGEPDRQKVEIGSLATEVAISRSGRITVVNSGPGVGYQICRWCGYTEMPGAKPTEEHQAPGRPGTCRGSLVSAGLFHWYLTDTVQVSPGLALTEPQATSALHALLAATEDVGVAHSDMNGATHPTGRGVWSFVLFDSVPGGAGHARRVREVLPELFTAARYRVEHCDCGEETSCYGCLRSYRNQRDHDRLERRLALQVFDMMGVT